MKTSSMLLVLPVVDRLAASASGTDTDVDASVDVRPAGEADPYRKPRDVSDEAVDEPA